MYLLHFDRPYKHAQHYTGHPATCYPSALALRKPKIAPKPIPANVSHIVIACCSDPLGFLMRIARRISAAARLRVSAVIVSQTILK
jgi:hypothetical protein